MTPVVVSGAMAAKAGNAGNAWTRLSWVGAFRRLGFDVWFVEELPAGADRAEAVAWAAKLADAHGLADRVVFADPGARNVRELVAESALVLNISGHLSIGALAGAGHAPRSCSSTTTRGSHRSGRPKVVTARAWAATTST